MGESKRSLRPAKKILFLLSTTVLLTVCRCGSSPKVDNGVKLPVPPKPKAWHVTTLAGGLVDYITSLYGIVQSGDTLYVIDQAEHSLHTVHTTTARTGVIVHGGGALGRYVDGAGTSARFSFPCGIVAADAGTLYVADSYNNRIRRVTIGDTAAATQVSTLAGSGTPGYGGYADDATGTSAQFNRPADLALSGTTLYVADTDNHRIRAIDLASANKTVSTIAGSGTPGHADGAAGTARFNNPVGLAVSGTTLYVAENGNHRIRAIDLASKTVSTLAGSGTRGHADGSGTAAQFNTPSGLALSGDTLYVADTDNHRIRAIDIATKTVRTIAGDGRSGTKNGLGTATRFNNPAGLAVSGDTLYVTTNEGLIRKLEYRKVDP